MHSSSYLLCYGGTGAELTRETYLYWLEGDGVQEEKKKTLA